MLIGSVIHDQIHDDSDATLLSFGNQVIHVFHRPIFGVDGFIVGYVITKVMVFRCVNRA